MVKKFLYVVSIVFALVAIGHLVRLVSGASMNIGDWDVPMYVSIVGLVVPGGLSFLGFHYAARCR